MNGGWEGWGYYCLVVQKLNLGVYSRDEWWLWVQKFECTEYHWTVHLEILTAHLEKITVHLENINGWCSGFLCSLYLTTLKTKPAYSRVYLQPQNKFIFNVNCSFLSYPGKNPRVISRETQPGISAGEETHSWVCLGSQGLKIKTMPRQRGSALPAPVTFSSQ